MAMLIPLAIIVSALVVVMFVILAGALVITIGRLDETNKQLLIVVAGKDGKPEALRALVASNRPPQKVIPGIANGKKKDNNPKNTDYTVEVGVDSGL